MGAVDGTRVRARRPPALRLLAAQLGYQLRLLLRSPIASFATLVIPLMVLLAVNLLYRGTRLSSRGGIGYAQFFTPAMVAFAVVNACYMAVISSKTLARDEGILKRIRSTPLPPWIYMAGRIVSAAIVAILATIVVIAVGDRVVLPAATVRRRPRAPVQSGHGEHGSQLDASRSPRRMGSNRGVVRATGGSLAARRQAPL
jgi:hypothetical protein